MNSNTFELITEESINNLEQFCSKLGYACIPPGRQLDPFEPKPSVPKPKKEPEKKEPEKPDSPPWHPIRWFPFFPKKKGNLENHANFRNNTFNLSLAEDGISPLYKILPNLIFVDIDDKYKIVIDSFSRPKLSVLNQEAYKLLMTFQESRD